LSGWGKAFHLWQGVNSEVYENAELTDYILELNMFQDRLMAGEPILAAGALAGIGLSLSRNMGQAASRGVVAAESRALVPYFPVANGFLGATSRTTLQVGTVIDRYGGTAVSRFFSPAGTPMVARALPPETAAQSLRSFEVIKALDVEAGTVAPAFGQLGLGTQYRTSLTLSELIEQGFVREIVQ